ncbi:MAG: type II CAAX endopeptidase family protein [Monoglobales bacterium]
MNKRISANLYIIMSIVFGYLLSAAVSSIYGNSLNSAQLVNMLNIVNILVITAIPTTVYVIFNRETFFGNFQDVPAKRWIKYICVLPIIWMTATYLNAAANNFLSKFGIELIDQLPPADNQKTLITGFFLACVVAPIFEELFYRGVVLSLLKGYGSGAAIVISSVLFAFGHNSVTILVSPFVLGLFLAYVTLKRKNVFLAILLHFESNLISWTLAYTKMEDRVRIFISLIILTLGASTAVFAMVKILKNSDKVHTIVHQSLQYIKNPLWLPILANYIYLNIINHG